MSKSHPLNTLHDKASTFPRQPGDGKADGKLQIRVCAVNTGNYLLMTNDPNYLDGLPAITEVEDLPGLGLLGVGAEIGVPATLWLIVLLFIPYWRNRRKGVVVACAALFQPMAHIFGMQITFFLPWFVTACALGRAFSLRSDCVQHGRI
jgi:hypothetical protein